MIVLPRTLCVTVFRKIEHSKLMHFDFSRYRTFNEGHEDKASEYRLEMIKGYFARVDRAEDILTVEEIGATLVEDTDDGSIGIGPSMLGGGEAQSLLKIELYVLPNDC